MRRCLPSWSPFFDQFLVAFWSQLRPPRSEKSSPRCSESTIFEKSAFQVNIDFRSHFGAKLPPFLDQKSVKIRSKIDPKRHQKNDRVLDRIFGHLGSILGAKLGPCWRLFRPKFAQRPPKTRQRTPQDALRCTQDAIRHSRYAPRHDQDALIGSKSRPAHPQTSISDHFGDDF